MRILHVEDNPEVVRLVRLMLSGHEVFSVSNVNDAIDLLRIKRFNVVLLDLKLSNELKSYEELGGVKLLNLMIAENINVPVILLTALSSAAQRAKNDYPIIKAIVNKPFLKKQLLNALRL